MEFGEFIRNKRKSLKILQIKAAKKIDISNSFMNDIEMGRRLPDDENIIRIAKFYNIDVDYLFYLAGKINKFNKKLSYEAYIKGNEAFKKAIKIK